MAATGQVMATATARSANLKRKGKGIERGDVLLYIVLITLAILFFFPIFWTISSSFKAAQEILNYPPIIIPAHPQLENYAHVFRNAPFARWILNTVGVVGAGTLGAVLSSSLAAYAFARFRFRGRDFLFLLTLGTLMLPAQVTLIPQYILWSKMGFVNSLYPLWVPFWFGGGAFNIFLLRQFIMTLPRELDEAALIDGANRFHIYRTIILPLSVPALATVVIISFLSGWDDYLSPLVYLNSQEMYTLALGLSFFRNYPETGGLPQQHLLMAAAVMTTLPPVILFLGAQRYFIRGIALSGIKG